MNKLLAKYILKYNFYILQFTSSSCMKPLFFKIYYHCKEKDIIIALKLLLNLPLLKVFCNFIYMMVPIKIRNMQYVL